MPQTYTINIEGMTCDGCRRHAEKALSKVPGVTSASVSLEAKQGVVTGNDLTPQILGAAVEKAGYRPGTVSVG